MGVIIQLFQHFFMLGSVQNEMLLGKALISREGDNPFSGGQTRAGHS